MGQLQRALAQEVFVQEDAGLYELFSDMVREEMITMEEALTRLSEADNLQENFLAEFMAEHGVKFT